MKPVEQLFLHWQEIFLLLVLLIEGIQQIDQDEEMSFNFLKGYRITHYPRDRFPEFNIVQNFLSPIFVLFMVKYFNLWNPFCYFFRKVFVMRNTLNILYDRNNWIIRWQAIWVAVKTKLNIFYKTFKLLFSRMISFLFTTFFSSFRLLISFLWFRWQELRYEINRFFVVNS